MNENQKKSRGGKREGAGRPKGSKATITVAGLLEAIELQAGVPYETLLIQDFIEARANDSHLAHKYHSLLSNKIMATLAEITVDTNEDLVEAKKTAFIEAISALNTLNKSKDEEDAID
jgi:hypothetical protein